MANYRGKWYVVWCGRETGVCDSWAECEARVKEFPGAQYKSYKTQEEAIRAFREGNADMGVLRAIAQAPKLHVNYEAIPEIERDSIAVDGACSGNPGVMEYRGVDVMTGAELFRNTFGDIPILLTGLEDPECNAHGENESLYLPDFEHGIVAETLFFGGIC